MGSHGEWKPLGTGELTTEGADQGLGHIVEFSTYTKVFLALIALTVFTVYVATHDFGILNVPIALAIASLKVSLVATFFMHAKFEGMTILACIIYPIFILAFMMVGIYGDIQEKVQPSPLIINSVG